LEIANFFVYATISEFKAYTNSNANSLCNKDLAEVEYKGYYGNVYFSECAPNVAETKPHKGRKPDCGFTEPKPPEQGGEQLPFVK
jgi:hypothetical protein